MKMKSALFLMSVFVSCGLGAAAASSSSAGGETPCVIAIPGQNGLGSGTGYVAELFPKANIERVKTPESCWSIGQKRIDLGQNHCMSLLHEKVQHVGNKDVIFHATSQGTATLINYLAAHPDVQQRTKGIVLEAVMATGNSAIVQNTLSFPGAYYIMPYLAKAKKFPSYSPTGKQAICSASKLSPDIPVVIIHAMRDEYLSVNDARALAYGLYRNGNPVRYIEKPNSSAHVNLLSNDEVHKRAMTEFLCNSNNSINTDAFNSGSYSFDSCKNAYWSLRCKEWVHVGIKLSAIAAALYGGYCYAKPHAENRGITDLASLMQYMRTAWSSRS